MKKISLIAMTSMMLMACTSNTISISLINDQQAARDSRISILNYAKDNSLTMYGMHMSKPVEF